MDTKTTINTIEELKNIPEVSGMIERYTCGNGDFLWQNIFNFNEIGTKIIKDYKFSENILFEVFPYIYGYTRELIYRYQDFSESLIERLNEVIALDWRKIIEYQNLTEDFKEKYYEYINLYQSKIYGYHSSNRPIVDFCGGDNGDGGNTLFMGVENEFDSPSYGNNSCTDRDKRLSVTHSNRVFGNDTYCYYMCDGSLSNGVEQITQPSTLEYYLSKKDCFRNIFEYFKSHKLKDRASCGLHIHFNRNYFHENEELYTVNLLYLVEKFWKEMVLYSRRNYKKIKAWSNKYDKTPEDVVKEPWHDRYRAINLCNRDTIEFRMFRATSDVEIYMNTIKLVHNLVVRAKTNDIQGLQDMKFEELLTDDEMKRYWKKQTTKAKLTKVEKEFSENKVKSTLKECV